MTFHRSLAFFVATILVVVSTAVLGGSALLVFKTLEQREWESLQRSTADQVQVLGEALVLPIWNYDEAQVERVIQSGLGERETLRIRVRYGSKVRSQVKASLPDQVIEAKSEPDFLVKTGYIQRAGESLGTIEIVSTSRYLKQDLARVRGLMILGVIGFDLLMVVALYALLWQILVKPVKILVKYAEHVSIGNRAASEVRTHQGTLEMDTLHESISRMVTLLDERYEKLMLSEQRIRALFHGSNDGIFVREFDPERSSIPFSEVNQTACEVLGYSEAELLRMTPYDLTPERAWGNIDALRLGLTRNGHVLFNTVHRTKSGQELQVELNAQVIDLGGRQFMISVVRDLSERHVLEEQLRHSQKLESLGLLAGGIAHDFNNVLQVIQGLSESMAKGFPEGTPNRVRMTQILTAVQRAAQLTKGLLAFSRKQPLERKPGELNAQIRNVYQFLKRVIGEDIDLVIRTCSEPLNLLFDPTQMEQVLMNLATNARDAMPKGGTLSIETDLVTMDQDFVRMHGFGEPGAWARITVSDTGQGMDEATRSKIFDPFFTTKTVGRGTGLGLAIVFGIIKQHGGQVNVYSEVGRGTSFKIYLPIQADALDQAEESKPDAEALHGSETILVAEDEELVRELMGSVLREAGYSVILATDGQDALERFQDHKADINLLLMDLIMPRMNGRAAYEKIREVAPQVRVLFTSGYTADIIQSRGELDDHSDLLIKPAAPVDILRKVRLILDRG